MELYLQYHVNVKVLVSRNCFDFPFDGSVLLQSPCPYAQWSSVGAIAGHTVSLFKQDHVSITRQRLRYISDGNWRARLQRLHWLPFPFLIFSSYFPLWLRNSFFLHDFRFPPRCKLGFRSFWLVVSYWRFGTNYVPHLKGSGSLGRSLNKGPIVCPEVSVNSCQ